MRSSALCSGRRVSVTPTGSAHAFIVRRLHVSNLLLSLASRADMRPLVRMTTRAIAAFCLLLATAAGLHAQTAPVTASVPYVNFGLVTYLVQTANQGVTFTFHAAETIVAADVLTEGLPGGDFTTAANGCVPGSYRAGATCTVSLYWNPRTIGVERGAIVLYTATAENPRVPIETVYLTGTGHQGYMAVSRGTTTQLGTLPVGYKPTHAATDPAGNVYLLEASGTHALLAEYFAAGGFETTTVSVPSSFATACCGIAFDGAGNLYTGNIRAGVAAETVIAPKLTRAVDVIVDGLGNAYILQTSGTASQPANLTRVTPAGVVTTLATLPNGAMYEAMDAAGNIYVSCATELVKVTPAGAVTSLFAIPHTSFFAIDAGGTFYFSLADVSGVKFTVPHSAVNGQLLGLGRTGGILYTEAGGAGGALRLVRLNRDAASVNFPATPVGESSSLSVVLTNVGNDLAQPDYQSSITGANGADFAVNQLTCTSAGLQPTQSCLAYFGFKPSAQGTRSASTYLDGRTEFDPASISFKGVGSAPVAVGSLNTTSINFGTYTCVGLGASNPQSVSLTNTGLAPLKLSADARISGAGAQSFVMRGNSCVAGLTLGPQQSCSLGLVSAPLTAGTVNATLSFSDNATNNPQEVALTGFGNTTPFLTAFNTSVLIQAPALHKLAATGNLVFQNDQCGLGIISKMAISGPNASDFSIVSTTCTLTNPVTPNTSCNVQFGYTPSSTSPEFATFTITDNSPDSANTFSMVGLYSPPN